MMSNHIFIVVINSVNYPILLAAWLPHHREIRWHFHSAFSKQFEEGSSFSSFAWELSPHTHMSHRTKKYRKKGKQI